MGFEDEEPLENELAGDEALEAFFCGQFRFQCPILLQIGHGVSGKFFLEDLVLT